MSREYLGVAMSADPVVVAQNSFERLRVRNLGASHTCRLGVGWRSCGIRFKHRNVRENSATFKFEYSRSTIELELCHIIALVWVEIVI